MSNSPSNNSTLAQYLSAARAAGCPKDQIERFVAAGVVLQPRQLAASALARECDRADGPQEIGYGGARAGGKSHWLIAQMGADDCQRAPGLKCLLLRKVGKANVEHFESLRGKVFQKLPHEYLGHRGTLTFANGSKIVAGHFQAEKDIDNYLGLEYDVIGVEEATTLTHRKYLDISTCCRSARQDFRPRIYSTTNPGGVGHQWYKERFLSGENLLTAKTRRHEEDAGNQSAEAATMPNAECRMSNQCQMTNDKSALRPSGFGIDSSLGIRHSEFPRCAFVKARVADNRFIDEQYQRRLGQLAGWQRRAWLEGDWDIAAGQFFTHFRQEVHVRPDFDPCRAVQWLGAMDYGFTHYTVFLLGAKDADGVVHIVEEHAEQRWLPERHAQSIHALLARHNLHARKLHRIVAGQDVFAQQYDGASIAEEYARCGLELSCANADRINGWAEILRRFGDPQAGIKPTLYIHPRCARLIGCIPALQHDPARPEDVLKVDVDDDTGQGGDDTADCLRYLVHTQPATLLRGRLQW